MEINKKAQSRGIVLLAAFIMLSFGLFFLDNSGITGFIVVELDNVSTLSIDNSIIVEFTESGSQIVFLDLDKKNYTKAEIDITGTNVLNLAVDVLGNGVTDFSYSGEFNSVQTLDFLDVLGTYIENCGLYPCNVPFVIYVDSVSTINLNNLVLEYEGSLITEETESLVGMAYELLTEENTSQISTNETAEVIVTQENETIVETIEQETNATQQVQTRQYGAVLGMPVKWEKKVKINTQENTTINNLTIDIPDLAGNVSVTKINNATGIEENLSVIVENERIVNEVQATISITGGAVRNVQKINVVGVVANFLRSLFNSSVTITGHVVEIVETDENVTVEIEEEISDQDEIIIEYYTEAPYAEELIVDENEKEVTIIGPDEVHYENVLAFSELPSEVADTTTIKLYHLVNNIKEETEFTAHDFDENGLYDYIEWIVPHLSNQTYEIIIITDALHLDIDRTLISDIYDYVKEQDNNWSEEIPIGHYVRVTFEQELDNTKDITLYARSSGTAQIEVYEQDQEEVIAVFDSITSEDTYKVYLTELQGTQDVFDLKILNNSVEFDLIIDPSLVTGICVANMNGSNTTADPCWITNCTQLQNMSLDLSGNFALDNNIDCSDTINWNSGSGWVPIGDYPGTQFAGNFSGNNYTISNLYINRIGEDYVGLFGSIQAGTNITNIGLINVTVNGRDSVGGLVGHLEGEIANSYSIGTITGAVGNTGGLVGSFVIGIISNSYTEGNINGGTAVGGLVGSSTGTITNSYSSVNVTSSGQDVGGLVGTFSGTITNSFSTGNVSASVNNDGGLVGTSSGTITNSYWNNHSGNPSQCYSGGDTGCTAISDNEAYFQGDVYPSSEPMASWDFFDVWEERSGDYPSLTWQGLGGSVVGELTYCRTLSVVGQTYTLQNDISTTGNCFNITNNNITLDGAGFSITGDGTGNDYGIANKAGMNNITIKNFGNINNFTRGIALVKTNNSLIQNNTILSLYASAHAIAIDFRDTNFINVKNNIVELNVTNTKKSTGIYISMNTHIMEGTNIISNNSIKTISSSSSAYSIGFDTSGSEYIDNLTISNNTILAISGSSAFPIWASNSGAFVTNLTIINNTINASTNVSNAGFKSYGIYMNNIDYSNVDSNEINVTAPNAKSAGVYVESDSDYNIYKRNIINNGDCSIYLTASGENTFLNNNLSSANNKEIIDASGAGNTNYLVYNNTYGEIIWTNTSFLNNMTVKGNLLSGQTIIISNNSAFVNSSVFTSSNINSSANITLYGIGDKGYQIPVVKKNNLSTNNYYNFTSLKIGTVVFNVTGFSSYSVEDIANLNYCQTLDREGLNYTLMSDISTTGDCFTITADNVTLDGNGYSIDGDDSGSDDGIYAEGRNNIIIKNFVNISDFDEGISFFMTDNSLVDNITFDSNMNRGILSTWSDYNNMTDLRFQNNNIGIYLNQYSSYNNLIRLTINSSGDTGITFHSTSSNNTLKNIDSYGNTNNEITFSSGIGNILIYNNSFGEIKFLNEMDFNIDGTLRFGDGQNIQIANNSVFVNVSGDLSELNISANITFNNYSYDSSYPLLLQKVYSSNKDYIGPGLSTSGQNFTSLTANTVIFNVSDFGNGTIALGKHARSSKNTTLNTGWNMFSLTFENTDNGTDRNISIASGWNLIGYSTDNETVQSSLKFTPTDGTATTWSAATSSGNVRNQLAYYDNSLTVKKYKFAPYHDTSLRDQKAYWVKSETAGNLTVKSAGGSYQNETYSWNDLMFTNGTHELNITDAADQNWIDSNINYWDIAVGFPPSPAYQWAPDHTTNLDPWKGYFINSKRDDITLLRQN